MKRPKAVVLDFGGVLVEFHGHKVIAALRRILPGVPEESWPGMGSWLVDWSVHHDYERGSVSTTAFCQAISDHLGLPLAEIEFTDAWNEIFGPVVDGIDDLLAELSQQVPLYLLSNTNAAHWQIIKTYPFMRHFKEFFTSFELGARKPEAEIFRRLALRTNTSPQDLLFVDDLLANVEAARAAGLQAEVCLNSSQRLRSILTVAGIL